MAKQYDIYLHHTIDEGTSDGVSMGAVGGQTETPQQAQKKVEKKPAGQNTARAIGVAIGTKALQYATSNYGNITGDQIGQAWVSEGIQIAGYVGIIAAKPILGSVAVATDIGIKAINRAIEVKKHNQEVQVLNERIGRAISSGGRR